MKNQERYGEGDGIIGFSASNMPRNFLNFNSVWELLCRRRYDFDSFQNQRSLLACPGLLAHAGLITHTGFLALGLLTCAGLLALLICEGGLIEISIIIF